MVIRMFSPEYMIDNYLDPPDNEQPCGLQHKKCGCFISPKHIRIDSETVTDVDVDEDRLPRKITYTEAWEVYWCKHCHCECTEAQTRLIFP